jgi:hypothetical protein
MLYSFFIVVIATCLNPSGIIFWLYFPKTSEVITFHVVCPYLRLCANQQHAYTPETACVALVCINYD